MCVCVRVWLGLVCVFILSKERATEMLMAFAELMGISGLKRSSRAPVCAGKVSDEHCRACFFFDITREYSVFLRTGGKSRLGGAHFNQESEQTNH